MSIRVLIIDDHTIIRYGLRQLLEQKWKMEVVGEAADGTAGIKAALTLSPDVVLMDLSLPGISGIEAIKAICSSQPQIRVVVLTMHSEHNYALHALQAGAMAYVIKTSAAEELREAIDTVMEGKAYISRRLSEALVGDFVSGTSMQSPKRKRTNPSRRGKR